MIQEIMNSRGINSFYAIGKKEKYAINESLNSFEDEDEAIISAQAKLLNELDRYNSGQGNEIDLAVACITSKTEVAANARVIETKKEMMDTILDAI